MVFIISSSLEGYITCVCNLYLGDCSIKPLLMVLGGEGFCLGIYFKGKNRERERGYGNTLEDYANKIFLIITLSIF